MPSISPDKRPAYYTGSVTINWTFSPDVSEVAFNTNGIPPAISKYIAYDTLNPPNPFIAVTQDGRGNVVYDGGFPKFYNHRAPGAGVTSFSGLNASFKYLYNALNFVANQEKVVAGNRKVLLLGDATGSRNYRVKGTDSSDFRTSFERLAAVAGYDLTIKDALDYGSALDARLAELDQYCCVIYMSSRAASDWQGSITDACVSDLVSYRYQGNGLIFITDHGNYPNSLDSAYANSSGFFVGANRVLVNFGAYFKGDYDRTSVNVGFLRNNYGDHPLYNGMADSEYISAGGSESQVVVTETPTTTPQAFTPTVLDTPGQYELNFLLLTPTGEVATYRFAYTVTEGNFLFVRLKDGTRDSGTMLSAQRRFDYPLHNSKPTLGTLQGSVVVNGYPVGEFSVSGEVTDYTWYAGPGAGFPMDNGPREFTLHLTTPVIYYLDLTIEGHPPSVPTSSEQVLTPGQLTQLLGVRDYQAVSLRDRLREYADHAARTLPGNQVPPIDAARQKRALDQYLTTTPTFGLYVYSTYSDFMNGRNAIPSEHVTAIVREGTETYLYKRSGSSWERLYESVGFRFLFGTDVLIRALNGGQLYRYTPTHGFVTV
jgi:hypothetical protein